MRAALAAMIGALRLFRWFALRHLGRYPVRTVAVVVGIALGAAVFTSVRLAVQATLDSYTNSMTRIAGGSDAVVLRPGGRVPDTLVAELLRHPAVATASPVLSAYVRPADHQAPFLLMGFDPVLDRGLRRWRAGPVSEAGDGDWGQLITRPGSLLMGTGLEVQYGWLPGDRVRLTHAGRSAAFEILDRLGGEGLALVEGGQVALVDIATFQEFTGLFGHVDWIDLRLRPETLPGALEEIGRSLPEGVVIRSPTARSDSGRAMIRAYQLSLTFLSFISLFVGMFLVYSLVALNAAARRRELAILRATGATPGQLQALFLCEGAFIGLCGWLVALPVSGVLVRHLLAAVSQTVSMLFVRVQVDALSLSPWEIVLSFGVTLGVAVMAAVQPAREAMAVPPREALEVAPLAVLGRRVIGRMAIVGTVLLALVWPVSRLPSPPAISVPGYLAALQLFVGTALLAPVMLRQFGRRMAPLLRRLGGQPAVLAAGYLRTSGVQTAISVGALITAVALFTALVIMVHSFRGTTILWVEQSIAGDLYVRPKLAELNRFRDPLPPRVVAAAQALAGPLEIVPMRRLELELDGRPHLFEAMDYAPYSRRSRFIWVGGDGDRIAADLIAGKGVAVSEVFANTTGLGPGDRYRVRLGDHLLDEPILGVFRDYRTRGGAVYYSLARYRAHTGDHSWSGVQINTAEGAQDPRAAVEQARSALLACCAAEIEMIAGDQLRTAIVEIFDETFAITTVLLLIALVVAALGIATTLAVLVLQRRRQLNTLVAVGASARQLRRMIFWEAGLIVTAGQAAGTLCGFVLSTLLIFVVNRQSFGWTFFYQVDWHSLLTALPLIFAAALAAALPAVNLALKSAPAELLRGGAP